MIAVYSISSTRCFDLQVFDAYMCNTTQATMHQIAASSSLYILSSGRHQWDDLAIRTYLIWLKCQKGRRRALGRAPS